MQTEIARMAAYLLATTESTYSVEELESKLCAVNAETPADMIRQAAGAALDVLGKTSDTNVTSLGLSPVSKRTIKQVNDQQADRLEEVVTSSLVEPFRDSIRRTGTNIARLSFPPDPDDPDGQAESILTVAFDDEAETEQLQRRLRTILIAAIAIGAIAELTTLRALTDRPQISADQLIRLLNVELAADVPMVAIGLLNVPNWLLDAANQEVDRAFSQPYWRQIPQTTRDNIKSIIKDGIAKRWSAGRIAQAIFAMGDSDYPEMRANRIARTEVNGALSAGHVAAIQQLSREAGQSIGKMWVAVLDEVTRDAHANLNGEVRPDPDGLFDLEGSLVPWPAHHSLPPEQRINCRCTLISTLLGDQLGE